MKDEEVGVAGVGDACDKKRVVMICNGTCIYAIYRYLSWYWLGWVIPAIRIGEFNSFGILTRAERDRMVCQILLKTQLPR